MTPRPIGARWAETLVAIVKNIQAYADLGVQMIAIPGHTDQMAEILPAMDMLAREVLPVFQ